MRPDASIGSVGPQRVFPDLPEVGLGDKSTSIFPAGRLGNAPRAMASACFSVICGACVSSGDDRYLPGRSGLVPGYPLWSPSSDCRFCGDDGCRDTRLYRRCCLLGGWRLLLRLPWSAGSWRPVWATVSGDGVGCGDPEKNPLIRMYDNDDCKDRNGNHADLFQETAPVSFSAQFPYTVPEDRVR